MRDLLELKAFRSGLRKLRDRCTTVSLSPLFSILREKGPRNFPRMNTYEKRGEGVGSRCGSAESCHIMPRPTFCLIWTRFLLSQGFGFAASGVGGDGALAGNGLKSVHLITSRIGISPLSLKCR